MSEATTERLPPLLVVDGLSKSFRVHGSDKYVHACDDVSFKVWAGESFGIVGESGSGKTTLGRCILRLCEPDSGEVNFDGWNLVGLSRRELRAMRQRMQIVFQEPLDSFNPLLTVGSQIAEPLRVFTKMSKRDREARARELLKLVGLGPEVAKLLPGALSTGMLQRCSIARAISVEPKLIVLDEPTSALPPETESDIVRLLKDLQERLGLAYVFISHDLSLVRSFCDRIAVMYLGEIVEIGTRAEIFGYPRHPYSLALLASTLVPDPETRRAFAQRPERLEGEIPSPIDRPPGCFLASRCSYARDRCTHERQTLEPLVDRPDHHVRCWRVIEGDLTDEELAPRRAGFDNVVSS